MVTEICNESEITFPNLAEVFSSNPNRTDHNYFSPGIVYLYSENVNPSPALKIRTSCKLSQNCLDVFYFTLGTKGQRMGSLFMRR